MTRVIHHAKRTVRVPFRLLRLAVVGNRVLWGSQVRQAWEPLATDKKLAWLLFVNHAIAIITLIEVFVLKSR